MAESRIMPDTAASVAGDFQEKREAIESQPEAQTGRAAYDPRELAIPRLLDIMYRECRLVVPVPPWF